MRCEFAGKHCTPLEYCIQLFSKFNDKTGNKKYESELTVNERKCDKPNDMQTERSTVLDAACVYGWLTSHPVQCVMQRHKNTALYIHFENHSMT